MSDNQKDWDHFLKEGFLIDSEGNYKYRFPHEKMCKKFGACYLQYIAASYAGTHDPDLLNLFLAEHKIPEEFFKKTILPMTKKFAVGLMEQKMNILGAAQLLKEGKFVKRRSWPEANIHLHTLYAPTIWERNGWPQDMGGNGSSSSRTANIRLEDLLADDWEEVFPPKKDLKVTYLPSENTTKKIPIETIQIVKKEPLKNPLGLEGAVSIG